MILSIKTFVKEKLNLRNGIYLVLLLVISAFVVFATRLSDQKVTFEKKDGSKTQPNTPVNPTKTLQNTKVGYRFNYPLDWEVRNAIVTSEFQASADECRSVEMDDGLVGGGGSVNNAIVAGYRSGVQVCAQALDDGLTLDQFMQNTYKENLSSWFTKTTLNVTPVYRSTNTSVDGGPTGKIIFLQTVKYRLQIYYFVFAGGELYTQRTDQVEGILKSFSLL